MPSLLESSWLIPASPLLASSLVGSLLFAFTRTMNRLTKPISFLLINSLIISTIFSGILFLKHQSGDVANLDINLLNQHFILDLKLDYPSEILLIVLGSIALGILTLSYFRLPRAKGYVGYITSLVFASGLLFFWIISSNFPTSIL